jgi:hypothetical protein
LFAGDVAGANQFAENALELLAADAQRPADVVEADLPMVRARQQIAENALGLDRQPSLRKMAFGTMVNCARCSQRTIVIALGPHQHRRTPLKS